MSTITTIQYNDDGTTARTAGEVLTINGGVLIQRTDTRWHATAPASMTGTYGGACIVSATLGGAFKIDGTKVRWLPFNTGTGNVPAIGTNITQGGTYGYLLSVYSSVTSAPTAVGAAMPTSGFLKFREVTGSYTTGALTGIGASATSADRVGWLEIVMDQSGNWNIPRLGTFEVRGDWFYLDNTTGSAGQVLQVPTNGGGGATEAPGIWIETSPGSDEYDFFPSLKVTTEFTTTSLGTDERSKFVQNMLSGQLRIGSDGTNNIGFVPVSGCKTRIPNVFFRQCTTGARYTNATPHITIGTRPDFTTTSAGYIDIEYFYGDWYLLFSQPYYVKLKHCATFDAVNISECATAFELTDGFTGMTGDLDINSLLLTSNFAGGTITDWGGPRGNAAGASDHDISVNYCIGQTFTRVRAGILAYARASGVPIYVNQSSNITFNNCRTTNGPITLNTSFGIIVNNEDHVDRYVGTTTTAAGYAIVITNSCDGVIVNGITFGLGGTINNVHPYTGIVSCIASSNIKLRNFGTRSSFLNGGSANQCAYAFVDGGNNVNVSCQRIYLTPTRTGIHSSINSSKNLLFEDCYGDYADAITSAGLNMLVRGGGGTNSVTGQASVYGTHFGGAFTSDTVGRIWLALNEPTVDTQQYTESNFSVGSGFTSAGGLSLATVGDYYICEMQVFKKQHTGFQNSAPTLVGTNTGNYSYKYQINAGNGWNGVWKTLNGTNLSGETIDPAIGFKLKFQITCVVAAATNLISYVMILTTSTYLDQLNNLYPLDTATIQLINLVSGSDIVILDAGTTTEIINVDSNIGSTYTTSADSNTYPIIDVCIYKRGYIPFILRNLTFTSIGLSLPITQIIDRNYID